MSDSFIQVPPDSTGKFIGTSTLTRVGFTNKVGNMSLGDIITGIVSGASGTVSSVILDNENSGEIYFAEISGNFIQAEALQVNNLNVAGVDLNSKSQVGYEYQKLIITDPINPKQMQRIDRFGATVNTFTDGAPVFGAYGAMTIGERQSLKDYRFAYDSLDNHFYDEVVTGGTQSYETVTGAILQSCSTQSGALCKRTSHFYHPYAPGVGQIIQMTARMGDTGKNNVRRRWGYYDDDNGVFFEHDGTNFKVVMRSSVSGAVVDTEVLQEDFNHDKLDGTDTINFTIDLSKPQIFWIDLQWLGSGRVRWGISEPGGEQIVAHVMEHANVSETFPYMRTATLPIRWEQENTGASPSTSEFRVVCASVKHSSKVLLSGDRHTETIPYKTISGSDGEVPLFAIRPKTIYKGMTNRALIKFISMHVTNLTAGGSAKIVTYRIKSTVSQLITGGTWAEHNSDSTAELNTTATSITPIHEVITLVCMPGQSTYVLSDVPKEIHAIEIFLAADATTQGAFFVTAEVDDGSAGDTARVGGAVNWEEILA